MALLSRERNPLFLRGQRIAGVAVAVAITGYGALLRLDAYVGQYGELSHPAWARIATHDIAPLGHRLTPHSIQWRRIPQPYVGGDPINYLLYAREMTSVYQPHVREPGFLAAVRIALAALDGQDAAVSLASAAGSLLCVIAVYLLCAALVSPLAGAAAALVMAIDRDVLSWSVGGWRDDLFTALVTLAAWGFVRFHRRVSFGNALLAGITGGLACLTRITALSCVIPALAWVAFAGGRHQRRRRVEYAAAALVLVAALVGPFLLSSAIATGDPFYAIDYHTGYYRFAEGMPATEPMNAGAYLRAKFAAQPIATLDAAITGELVRPFNMKWQGLAVWSTTLAAGLEWTALAGLLLLPFSKQGRLLLLILMGSLLPYAFTWNVGDGGEWRFTMHAYPLYLAAAALACAQARRVARVMAKRPAAARRWIWTGAGRGALICAGTAIALLLYQWLPWYVVREAVARRESVSVEVGPRDSSFYRDGWSPAHREGVATVRVSTGPRAVLRFPLPAKGAYDLVLRLDPVAPGSRQSVDVLFNQQLVLHAALTWDPQRVGTYRTHLPEEWTRAGSNEVVVVPRPLVRAGSAGTPYTWLDPAATLGVRFWFARVVPLGEAAGLPAVPDSTRASLLRVTPPSISDVELLGFFRALHDEAEARRRVLAHQLVDHAIGDDLIGDVDAQQPPRARVERRFPQHLRHHLAEPLEARDLRRAAAVLARAASGSRPCAHRRAPRTFPCRCRCGRAAAARG